MRKSKRFIKKFSERFIVYIVVFVAFVNACFFMPMEVQAAVLGGAETSISLDGSSGEHCFIISGDGPSQFTDVSFPNDTHHRFSVDVVVAGVDTSFSDGDYFEFSFELFLYGAANSDSYLDMTVYTDTFDIINPSVSGGYDNDNINFTSDYDVDYKNGSTIGVTRRFIVSGYYNRMYHLKFSFDFDLHYWGVNAPTMINLFGRINSQSLIVRDTSDSYGDVLDQIEQNTGETTDAVNNGFNQSMNGYDDSSGNQISSDFESGVNDYDQPMLFEFCFLLVFFL